MISKHKRNLKPESRAAMGAAGKIAQQRRWGAPRSEATTIRISKDVSEAFRAAIPEAHRRTVADRALLDAIRRWAQETPGATRNGDA